MNQQAKENLLKSMMNASLDDKAFDPKEEDVKRETSNEDNEDQIECKGKTGN